MIFKGSWIKAIDGNSHTKLRYIFVRIQDVELTHSLRGSPQRRRRTKRSVR